jgi:hypothetical protein
MYEEILEKRAPMPSFVFVVIVLFSPPPGPNIPIANSHPEESSNVVHRHYSHPNSNLEHQLSQPFRCAGGVSSRRVEKSIHLIPLCEVWS